MTFGENVCATLIGTVAGFLFSIALFYVREKVKHTREREKTIKNLRREFVYDVGLLGEWVRNLTTARAQVAAGTNVFRTIPYTRFSRAFVQEAFRSGIIFEIFNDEEVASIDELLGFFWTGGEQFVNDKLAKWDYKREEISAKEVVDMLQFNIEKIEEHQKTLGVLVKKCDAALKQG